MSEVEYAKHVKRKSTFDCVKAGTNNTMHVAPEKKWHHICLNKLVKSFFGPENIFTFFESFEKTQFSAFLSA